jgi:hypothetical protein
VTTRRNNSAEAPKTADILVKYQGKVRSLSYITQLVSSRSIDITRARLIVSRVRRVILNDEHHQVISTNPTGNKP